jgi:hypothetical protein
MTDFDKFAQALALTESNDNPQAFGDDGLAYGRWQMHPAFVDEWWPAELEVLWSWDHLFRAALLRFYSARFQPGRTLEQVVMEFHLGVHAVAEGKWDQAYQKRFQDFYNQVSKQ